MFTIVELFVIDCMSKNIVCRHFIAFVWLLLFDAARRPGNACKARREFVRSCFKRMTGRQIPAADGHATPFRALIAETQSNKAVLV
jgi:hypothetical protein